jgi:hypothetical protein
MAETFLPAEFADLEPFAVTWCLPTEPERYEQRLTIPMDEMQVFYDAITVRAKKAMEYCDQFALNDMPEEATNLLHLLFSMVMVSFPIECWGQGRIPDAGAAYLDQLVAPGP